MKLDRQGIFFGILIVLALWQGMIDLACSLGICVVMHELQKIRELLEAQAAVAEVIEASAARHLAEMAENPNKEH